MQVGLSIKTSLPAPPTTTCAYLNKSIGLQKQTRNEIYATYMEYSSTVNSKVATQILPYRVSDLQYDIYMRVDSNTNGHRQWFYFSMKNEAKTRVKLHIYRFKKIYSLFQRGMKPYVRSRKGGQDWQPGGENVTYHYERQRNEYGVKKDVKTCVLTFTYTFEHDNDEVFIAAGIPYTYTFLQRQLMDYKTLADLKENLTFEVTTICKSMCRLDLQLITIEHKMAKLIHQSNRKRFIIINARTHSGEASCSWVLDGMLKEFGSSAVLEQWILSENICFKIIPMLNPDGVFIGNYRTGIIGDDFNRRFSSGRKQFYPEIWALKKLVTTCKRQGDVQLFLDLHGHSVLKNSFIYGPAQSHSVNQRLKNLPYHLFHNSKYFRLASCKFQTVNTDNIETARIFFQAKEDILTFTCQNSLGLYINKGMNKQMQAEDWQAFGKSILHQMRNAFNNSQIALPPSSDQKGKISKISFQKVLPNKPSIVTEIQKKLGTESYPLKNESSKSNKHDKIYFKLPTTSVNIKQKQNLETLQRLKSNSVSLSQKITREDQIFDPFRLHPPTKPFNLQTIKNRKHSEIIKTPTTNIIQRALNKVRKEQSKKNKSSMSEEPTYFNFERASTYDTSQALIHQIQKTKKIQEDKDSEGPEYEMQAIPENFSEDYCSINDSDSSDQDIADNDKNYIFEYIRSNQLKLNNQTQGEDERDDSPKQKVSKLPKEINISKFRQIRFNSIDELYNSQSGVNRVNSSIKKIKLQIHKFKDTPSKQFINHFNNVATHAEFDGPGMLAISQQKKLNERTSLGRRTQKDPFVLIQRKDRSTEQSINEDS